MGRTVPLLITWNNTDPIPTGYASQASRSGHCCRYHAHMLDISVEAPTIQEIKIALMGLRNGKAPGTDQISAEMQKQTSNKPAKNSNGPLTSFGKKRLPTQWTKRLIYKLPKKVMTGVKQGCCPLGFLFLVVTDRVMRKTVEGERTGIRRNFTTVLEDLDFADDLALLSSAMNHLQNKTTKLEDSAAKVGLRLNAKKCKAMKVNSENDDKLKVGGSEVEESLVLSVLLYGCETWKVTEREEEKLDTFQTKFLRRIFKIRWHQHVSNKTILEMTEAGKISEEVRRRRWNWIRHIMRKERNDDCAVPWLDNRGKKEKRPTENNMAANGGKGEKRRRLENMECCTPYSCRPNTVEERRASWHREI
ncbi:hypothetical protein AWC38_SpisGene13524 [Stylophora pistillata]|uniref:Reverse transcriptase domain-containing protein n=1 Tax=Stylophora pistillata TaxID=50429 RepID=A0A2B4RYU8_STYPI|nr:hypothetical protein AWC38_SpisGene13524 [Stylophora pistillata]